MIAKTRADYRAYRISPGDSNRLVLVFDPIGDEANFVFAIEIFDVGGRTPPNMHSRAQEMFHVLAGEGMAHADGKSVGLKRGDSLLLPPGTVHQIENTGASRLYCLTVMVPNQDFAELIRGGEPVAIDDEDWAVLLGPSSAAA
ncbi:MAG TPA: cupin domain-containing protein [Stellaceae bacterium]|nr:cupin domain-containing protein [Stellaceae bacterium]